MNHDSIKEILGELLTKLQLPFTDITVEEADGITRVDIKTDQASKIIGWHGATLNSLQHIVKAMIRGKEKLDRSPFIVLDVDGYRTNQEDRVCQMADRKADIVRRTGNRIALPPMSPYFRRIVHLHVAGSEKLADLSTESTGEGDYRQIVLRLKDESAGATTVNEEGEMKPIIEDGLDNLDI